MRITHVIGTISLANSIAFGTLATGAVSASETRDATRVERGAGSSIPQLQEKLTVLGYKDIGRIEREKDAYEVHATTTAGERVQLNVDARSGEILRTKSEGRERGRESKRSGKEDRHNRDCSERRCRDDGRVQTLSSEAMGWDLQVIYGRMKSAGI
jgi:hypothetical protein